MTYQTPKAVDMHDLAMSVKAKEVETIPVLDKVIQKTAEEGGFEIMFSVKDYMELVNPAVVLLIKKYYTDNGYTVVLIDDPDLLKVRLQIKWSKPTNNVILTQDRPY